MKISNIFFIGGVFDEKTILDRSLGGVQFASNTLQWALIKGLKTLTPIKILNSAFVGTFPKYHKDIIEKSYTWDYEEEFTVHNVGFINIFLVKNIHRMINMSLKLMSSICGINNKKSNNIIIVYGMHTPFVVAASLAKKIWKDTHLSIIITDLPDYMSQRQG